MDHFALVATPGPIVEHGGRQPASHPRLYPL